MASAVVVSDDHLHKEGGDDQDKKVEELEEQLAAMEIEPKTGVSFPVMVDDGKELVSLGLRKKGLLALQLKIYSFGIYADVAKLKELLKIKFPVVPSEPTKELYESVIDADVGLKIRLVMVFGGLTMGIIRKSFDEGIGASMKKLTGGQDHDELLNKIMGDVSGSLRLPKGSVIELTRLPGDILQTKVKGEIVSNVESELVCRAYFHMYLGDEPFDKEAKNKFGSFLLTLFSKQM